MSQAMGAGLLARKAGQARAGGERGRSPWAQAWNVVVPRIAEQALGIEAGLLKARHQRQDLTEFLEGTTDTGLLLRLQGPGSGVGVAHLDCGFLAALLEAQTVGRVLQAPAPERAGTKTDAAIVASAVGRLIGAVAAEAADRSEPEPPWSGFTVSGRFADRRAVELQFDAGPMEVARTEVDFGGGLKTGALCLAVRREHRMEAARATAGDRAGFTESVMGAAARLPVVLDRPRVSIGWVRGLEPGSTLTIPRARLGEARIETTHGAFIARARLGQAAGQRAVRLTLASGGPDRPAPAAGLEAHASTTGAGGPPVPPTAMAASGANELAGLAELSVGPGGGDAFDLPGPPGGTAAGGLPDLPDLPDLPGLPEMD